jgi:hypothetical protein
MQLNINFPMKTDLKNNKWEKDGIKKTLLHTSRALSAPAQHYLPVALSASILCRQTGQILIQARPVESFCTFSGSVASILFSMGSVA